MDIPAGRSEDLEFGPLGRFLALWDTSKFPTSNDRETKLGAGIHQKAASYYKFDEDSQLAGVADGLGTAAAGGDDVAIAGQGNDLPGQEVADEEGGSITAPEFSSIRTLNPDNWIARLTDEGGLGPTGTWDTRLSIDGTNPQNERTNRGTMVLDQADQQLWGWLSDILRVTDRLGKVSHKELEVNPAGFLDMLYPPEKRGTTNNFRGELALNVSSNAGLVTDTSRFGPLAHVLTWRDSGAGTVAAASGVEGRPAEKAELCLKADAAYRWPDGKTRSLPVIGDPPDDKATDTGKPAVVHFYEGVELGAGIEMAVDPQNNFSKLTRKGSPAINAYVKIPSSPPG